MLEYDYRMDSIFGEEPLKEFSIISLSSYLWLPSLCLNVYWWSYLFSSSNSTIWLFSNSTIWFNSMLFFHFGVKWWEIFFKLWSSTFSCRIFIFWSIHGNSSFLRFLDTMETDEQEISSLIYGVSVSLKFCLLFD